VTDPSLLLGQSLAVVRFGGEPLTPRHLGPAVILAPDERGIAVRVQADTGLAGLLRPGMAVGLIATLPVPNPTQSGGLGREVIYAKSTLANLRVLYVPPSFQARTAPQPQSSVAPDGSYVPPAPQEPIREGVIVLAAGTLPEPVRYESAADLVRRSIQPDDAPAPAPEIVWAVPVELLAALNAADAAFTLVLEPADAHPFASPGVELMGLVRNEE
jgi:hypothetical protein